MTDEELVLSAQGGDKGAESELLKKYNGMVRSVARGFFLAGGETEDLIQEGMIGLYSAISSYKEGKTSFKSYAKLCVSRKIMDAVKASLRQKNMPLNNYTSISGEDADFAGFGADVGDDADEDMIRTEDASEFLRKISGILSDSEFRVAVLYMDGMSYKEIADATGKDFKSIDNALSRAKKKLQKIYKGSIGKK